MIHILSPSDSRNWWLSCPNPVFIKIVISLFCNHDCIFMPVAEISLFIKAWFNCNDDSRLQYSLFTMHIRVFMDKLSHSVAKIVLSKLMDPFFFEELINCLSNLAKICSRPTHLKSKSMSFFYNACELFISITVKKK